MGSIQVSRESFRLFLALEEIFLFVQNYIQCFWLSQCRISGLQPVPAETSNLLSKSKLMGFAPLEKS
jgi:hypothetical protein